MGALSRFAVGFCLLAPFGAPASAAEPDGPDQLITHLEAVDIAIQDKLTEKFHSGSESHKTERGALVEFYAENKAPIWVGDAGLTERGKKAVAEIHNANSWGLNASDYDLPREGEFADKSAEKLATVEVKISFAIIDYARDARGGRLNPQKISAYLDPTLRLPDPLETITGASKADNPATYLTGFNPRNPQFEALRKILNGLGGAKVMAVSTGAPAVRIPNGPILRHGLRHPQVALLRERLSVADAGSPEANQTYDADLERAVRQFQASIGIKPDGLVGNNMRKALNRSAGGSAAVVSGSGGGVSSARRKQILVNMERWRWLPNDLGSTNVRVNIPEFLVRVYKNGQAVHTERVVAGKLQNQTPIFSATMQEVVFNPYWNVPNSIKMAEILPYLRDNTGWMSGAEPSILSRHNLFVKYRGRTVDPSTVNWSTVDIRRFDIYQPPGEDNVLGNVKFVFPNKHDVYMHDTPQKSLFNKTVRAESHGCMRVRNPLEMAEVLLGWNESRIQASIRANQDQHVRLPKPVPVHITYFTSWVDENGKLLQFGDIYGHDSKMIRAMKL